MAGRAHAFTQWNMDVEPGAHFDPAIHKHLIYGREICPTSDREHYQGYVRFFEMTTCNNARKSLGDLPGREFWIAVARKDQFANSRYCKKEGEFKEFGNVGGQGERTDVKTVVKLIMTGAFTYDELKVHEDYCDLISGKANYFREIDMSYKSGIGKAALKVKHANSVLKPWQVQLLTKLTSRDAPEERKVYWYWDKNGNTGKSFMTDYLIAKSNAIVFSSGKGQDFACAYNYEPVVVFDLARTQEDCLSSVYKAIEDFKNGRIFSGKYLSHTKTVIPPDVFVFANFEPDRSKLSKDRWHVTCLDMVATPPAPDPDPLEQFEDDINYANLAGPP